ncbi:MAG: DNA polymerase III subunit beta [Candidatus Microthrix parvicella]|nr:DNA polymerase III subunit beta [Candidatus Microthrix parvicella]
MKFRCERDVLADAVGSAGRATSGRGGALPVLAGLRLRLDGDHLEITGSDLDLTVTAEIEVAGGDDGGAVIPARLMADIVRALEPGAVNVEVTEDQATITGGRSEFSVNVIPPEEYPQVSEPTADSVTLSAEALADGLRQVVPAASNDDNRLILTGVQLAAEGDGLRLVATDSYRLAVRDLGGQSVLEEGQSVLVPSRALTEVIRSLGDAEEVTLVLGAQDATFRIGGVRVTTRLISGDFPNYRGLIPETQANTLTVDRHALIEAVRRVKLMARESTPIRLEMSHNSLELVAVTQDVGHASERMDVTFEGEGLTIAFNPDYLLDGLDAARGEEVRVETIGDNKPAVLRGSDADDFLYLLMPVRVS